MMNRSKQSMFRFAFTPLRITCISAFVFLADVKLGLILGAIISQCRADLTDLRLSNLWSRWILLCNEFRIQRVHSNNVFIGKAHRNGRIAFQDVAVIHDRIGVVTCAHYVGTGRIHSRICPDFHMECCSFAWDGALALSLRMLVKHTDGMTHLMQQNRLEIGCGVRNSFYFFHLPKNISVQRESGVIGRVFPALEQMNAPEIYGESRNTLLC